MVRTYIVACRMPEGAHRDAPPCLPAYRVTDVAAGGGASTG